MEISGTASKPELAFDSSPPRDDADVLAVLMFGKPANELGGSEQRHRSSGRRVTDAFSQPCASVLVRSPRQPEGHVRGDLGHHVDEQPRSRTTRARWRSLTSLLCHIKVTLVRRTTIRELEHDTSTVLDWVAAGERVEVCRGNQPVAILSPPGPTTVARPDFAARLRAIYGAKVLRTTGSDLISASRGDG